MVCCMVCAVCAAVFVAEFKGRLLAYSDKLQVKRVAVCCSVLQCVAVCCIVLQCVAVSAAVSAAVCAVASEGWMRTYCDKLKVECVAVCVLLLQCVSQCVFQ